VAEGSSGWPLGELATRCGAQLHGDADCRIYSVAAIDSADDGAITFLSRAKFKHLLASTNASAVILGEDALSECPVNALVSTNPYATYARVAALLNPPVPLKPGIAASAVVDSTAAIDPSAEIGAQVVIGANVIIGANAQIGPGCVLDDQVIIGADTRLSARVTINRGVQVGQGCLIHPGVVLGADGFGFAPEAGEWVKIPQIGSVIIADQVEIGANTTVDRGALGNTHIGHGVKLDNLIQIGHNVQIGPHTVVAAHTAIAGSTKIGAHCMIAGAVAISEHLEIADEVIITGMSMVTQSITEKGSYSSGIPFTDTNTWRRNTARFKQLDQLVRQLKKDRQ
jgi:UDP-3-O-[3-hydroxymyristoyl] glucosamine N-acyltransferase